jgi:hypothetical protein
MAQVSSLWIGKPLSRAHQVALASFPYYGHSLKLYVYDMDLEVPPGVVKADANEIIPESEVFVHYGKLAPFADYFRYKMISKTNEMWVDADTICVSDYFFEDKDYVFIEEMPGFYAQGILKMPSDSDLSKFLNDRASTLLANRNKNGSLDINTWNEEDNKSWIFLGPGLLSEAVNKLSLQEHGQPALLVNGLDLSVSKEDPYDLLWNPENHDTIMKRLSSSVSITFFNSSLDFKDLTDVKNILTEGSVMQELEKKFLG